jgi:hypothetical protein
MRTQKSDSSHASNPRLQKESREPESSPREEF